MGSISEDIVKKIKDEHLKPRPRWMFQAKEYFFWLFFLISVFLTSLAVLTCSYLCFANDWDLWRKLEIHPLLFLVICIPYLWIALALIFGFFAYRNFTSTKQGYKYEGFKISGSVLILSVILSLGLFSLGLDSEMHDFFSMNVPRYDNLVFSKEDLWNNPDKGIVAGEIIDIKDNNVLVLKDLNGKTWEVTADKAVSLANNLVFSKGQKIKIIGEDKGEGKFNALEFRPW